MSEESSQAETQQRRACPICGNTLADEARSAPFCSEQCRLVDLHRWFTGRYALERPLEERDLEE